MSERLIQSRKARATGTVVDVIDRGTLAGTNVPDQEDA